MFLLAGVATACGSDAPDPAQAAGPMSMTCTIVSRPNVYQAPGAKRTVKIRFGDGEKQQSRTSEKSGPFVWTATKSEDEEEGRSLSVKVTVAKTDRIILQTLYQLNRPTPPTNNFDGGHGFTGLHYVIHPKTEAELQYFCSVDGDRQ